MKLHSFDDHEESIYKYYYYDYINAQSIVDQLSNLVDYIEVTFHERKNYLEKKIIINNLSSRPSMPHIVIGSVVNKN